MNLKTALEEHRKMWLWMAYKADAYKSLCVQDRKLLYLNSFCSPKVKHLCYLCEYVSSNFQLVALPMGLHIDCSKCPLSWLWGSDDATLCESAYSPFTAWKLSKNEEELKLFALIIANSVLPLLEMIHAESLTHRP